MAILQNAKEHAQSIKAPPMFDNPILPMKEFSLLQMGAKSNNLKIMSEKIPDWIQLPDSICLPFQLMEYTLQSADPAGNARI